MAEGITPGPNLLFLIKKLVEIYFLKHDNNNNKKTKQKKRGGSGPSPMQ